MRKIINIILVAALIACVIWAAVAPRMQALIPLILGIVIAEILVARNTNYITHF